MTIPELPSGPVMTAVMAAVQAYEPGAARALIDNPGALLSVMLETARRALAAQAAAAAAYFTGHERRECGEHRTAGERAWCFECTEWCYPAEGCKGCRVSAQSPNSKDTPEGKQMTEPAGTTPVVVTTEHRGVFFGYLTADSNRGSTMVTLTDAQMCVYWSAEVRGVLGLGATGPLRGCKITPAVPRITLQGVVAVFDATDEAVKAWQDRPWS